MKKQKYNWPQLIAQWQQSGQNQAAFCRDQGLSYWTFREALKKADGKPGSNGKQKPRQPRSKKEPAFVKLPTEDLTTEPTGNFTSAMIKDRKPWLSIFIGPKGFQFEINLKWGR
ncbi:MAG: IS66 family insertion sequence element accessory protein TnpA [Planctomycetota bacterium]|jgi:hypothetical protein